MASIYESPFDKKENTNRDEPILVVADLGNNYLKGILYEVQSKKNGRHEAVQHEVVIPHGYVELTEPGWIEAQRSTKLSRQRTQLTRTFKLQIGSGEDKAYKAVKIGLGATRDAKNSPLLGSNKYQPCGIDALLVAVLSELMPPEEYPSGHNNIILAIGHPPTEWEQAETITRLVTRALRVEEPDGNKRKFHVRACVPYDEAAGGVVHLMANKDRYADGKFRPQIDLRPGDRVIVFDAGGRLGSMSYAFVNDDGLIAIDFDTSREIDGGSIMVRQELKASLKAMFPEQTRGMQDRDYTDDLLNRMILTRKWPISGKRGDKALDVGRAVDESLHYLQTVRQVYKNDFAGGRTAKHIFLTGGTIADLHSYIVEDLSHDSVHPVAKLETINMANPRGAGHILIDKLMSERLLPSRFQKALLDSAKVGRS